MNQEEFDKIYENLTPQQKKVLHLFLEGHSDEQIANQLYIGKGTVRSHICKICNAFSLSNQPGEHYSYREELIDLFITFNPILVSPNKRILPSNPEAPLSANSPFYIKRAPFEQNCLERIDRPDYLIRVIGSRKTGKTSLINYIIAHARQQENYQIVYLSLNVLGSYALTSLSVFYRSLCKAIGKKIGIANQLVWDDYTAPNVNFTDYFQDFILPEIPEDRALILALDNLDLVFESVEIAENVCQLFRNLYESANRGDGDSYIWQKLRLILAHSRDKYPSLNISTSPLGNVGYTVQLQDFDFGQTKNLVRQYALLYSDEEIEQIINLLGGHPYLLNKGLNHIKEQKIPLGQLLEEASIDSGIYGEHLLFLLAKLNQNRNLADTFCQLIQGDGQMEKSALELQALERLGLVIRSGNSTIVRCGLYRIYFLQNNLG